MAHLPWRQVELEAPYMYMFAFDQLIKMQGLKAAHMHDQSF